MYYYIINIYLYIYGFLYKHVIPYGVNSLSKEQVDTKAISSYKEYSTSYRNIVGAFGSNRKDKSELAYLDEKYGFSISTSWVMNPIIEEFV
jgi:hypothetical protein